MEIKQREVEEEFNNLMQRLASRYASEAGYKMGEKYIRGLLGTAERKNGWQLAEYVGETTPYAVQQFIYRGRYSAEGMRDELRGYVSDELGEADGLLVVDDTGFLKQGKKSCGVKRQYSGLVAFASQTLLAHAAWDSRSDRELPGRSISDIRKPERAQPDRQAAVHAGRMDERQ